MTVDIILRRDTNVKFVYKNLTPYKDEVTRKNRENYYDIDKVTITIGIFKENDLHIYIYPINWYDVEIIEKGV